MKDKRIILGITGGIAAYKAAELLRLLKTAGADVRVVMTQSAESFITPLTFQALSGHTVHTNTFAATSDAAMDHIELSRWADMIMVAPATADFIARLVHGRADDLLATICLASTTQLAIAPAMNQQMWLNKATQDNIALLNERRIISFGPGEGEQACGEIGPGRMLEPQELFERVDQFFQPRLLDGKKILVTAGPTRESIDPVRYLTNHSTGTMGYAIAEAAALLGANVTLVSGPVNLPSPFGVACVSVETAKQMHDAVMSCAAQSDIFIATAAVADYRMETISSQKIKKSKDELLLRLIRNPDVLASVTQLADPPFTVGFAAETENLVENATKKLQHKNLDMIVANQVGQAAGFGDVTTRLTVLNRQCESTVLPPAKKPALAKTLLERITQEYLCLSECV